MMTAETSNAQLRTTDDASFDADLGSARLVLVKFTGTWCPPCKALQPTLDAVARDRRDLVVLSVDVDASQQVAQRYGVRAVPTLIAFRDGKPFGQLVGNQPRSTIDKLLAISAPAPAPAGRSSSAE
ncbi:MAG: thioredoxin family protein [Archangium sp.]|nr:thioredoxin family protein [Archangium sp.]